MKLMRKLFGHKWTGSGNFPAPLICARCRKISKIDDCYVTVDSNSPKKEFIARKKEVYNCFHVTENTTAKEFEEFNKKVDRKSYLMNTDKSYWLVHGTEHGYGQTFSVSEEEFAKKYELIEEDT